MKKEFLLPDLGEGLADAEVVQWLVAPGDTVELNQTLAEVETAKAVVELPSPYAGVVHALHAAAGETVDVGAPLIEFEIPGEPEPAPTPDAPVSVDGEEKAQPNLVGYGAAPRRSERPARRARRTDVSERPATDQAVRDAAPHDAIVSDEAASFVMDRPRSTPPVRKYAKDHGIDLALVAAYAGDAVITRAHVDEYRERLADRTEQVALGTVGGLAAQHPESGDVPHRGERSVRIPIRGVRKHTAAAMVRSAFTAPHVTVFQTVDVTAMTDLVASLRADKRLAAHRIGPLAIVAKAVCLELPHHPGLNAFWDEESSEIVENRFVDLGIAAATDRGLIVPVIRDAERLSLTGLSDAIRDLAVTARSGKTPPADLTGGTFSITNIGVFGVDAGTPILPPGQSGILAVGAVRRQPWEYQGEIALRDVLTLSLSFDHRVVDGAEGSQFLVSVADVLREPGRALLLR